MPINRGVFFLLSFLLLVQSCTIEKRRYTSGFHVEWNHKNGSFEKPELQAENSASEKISAIPSDLSEHQEQTAIQAFREKSIEHENNKEHARTVKVVETKVAFNSNKRLREYDQTDSTNFRKASFPCAQNAHAEVGMRRKMKNTHLNGMVSMYSSIGAWVITLLAALLLSGGTSLLIIELLRAISQSAAFWGAYRGFKVINHTKEHVKGKKRKKNGRTAAIVGSTLGMLYLLLVVIVTIALL